MCKRLGVVWDLKKYTNTFCSDFKDTAKSTVKSFQGIIMTEAEFLALWTTYAVLGHMHTSHGFSNSIWLEKRTIGQSRQLYNWTGVRDSEAMTWATWISRAVIEMWPNCIWRFKILTVKGCCEQMWSSNCEANVGSANDAKATRRGFL